jgi:beta-galactosidase
MGKRIHYYFNYSGAEVRPSYSYAPGTELIHGNEVSHGAELTLAPWDLAIIEEK